MERRLWYPAARIGGGDAVNLHEIGNSRQQHREEKNNHGEAALGVFHGRLAKGLHAVADSFDAGQCRTTAGKDFQQQPVGDGLGHRRRRRKRSRRHWMSAAEENADNACDDGNQKRADKKIRGKCEGQARIAHAAEIDDGDDDQNAHADGHRVR